MREFLKKKLIFIFIAVFISNCSGTGSSFQSVNAQLGERNSGGKVFVYREDIIACGLYLLSVYVNGERIAKLGKNETAVGDLALGKNVIETRITGLGSYCQKPDKITVNAKSNENKFVLMHVKNKNSLSPEAILEETTETIWRSEATK